jgi:hypothetical protein
LSSGIGCTSSSWMGWSSNNVALFDKLLCREHWRSFISCNFQKFAWHSEVFRSLYAAQPYDFHCLAPLLFESHSCSHWLISRAM